MPVTFYVVGTLALACVFGLASYAIHLKIQLIEQRRRAAASAPAGTSCTDHRAARAAALWSQLTVLAQAGLSGEVNLSEVTLRVRYLLDHLDPDQVLRSDWEGIYIHYEAIKDLAVKEERAALSLADRRQQDRERQAAEDRHASLVRDALQALRARASIADEYATRH